MWRALCGHRYFGALRQSFFIAIALPSSHCGCMHCRRQCHQLCRQGRQPVPRIPPNLRDPTQVMSVAAAAATLQASRVRSGAEACSRTGGTACWGCRPTGWQQEQGRRRGGAHRLMAAQTQGRSASRRPLVARAAAEPAEAPPQAAAGALVPDRQGYRSFLLVSPWAVSGRGGSACIRTSAEVQSLLAVEPLTMRSAV